MLVNLMCLIHSIVFGIKDLDSSEKWERENNSSVIDVLTVSNKAVHWTVNRHLIDITPLFSLGWGLNFFSMVQWHHYSLLCGCSSLHRCLIGFSERNNTEVNFYGLSFDIYINVNSLKLQRTKFLTIFLPYPALCWFSFMFSVALNYLSLATVFSVVLLLILFAFCSYRMPWCVVTPDVAGAEWGTGHNGWRPTRWEEKQFGAPQQHPRSPQQEQCGETQRNHLYKTLISSLICGED